jgi:hypothetical protein
MKNKIQKPDKEFHTVEFMRKVREELSELFIKDRNAYLKELDTALADFKIKQKEVFN